MRFLAPMLLALAACAAPTDGAAQDGGRVPGTRVARAELPALTGRVVDTADLLGPAAEAELDRVSADLERRTGDQMVVVTLPGLSGHTIEETGLALGRGWGIGQRGRDNGILLLVARDEKKVRIEVGCGLERIMTVERAARIIQDRIVPAYKQARFDEGTAAGAQAIAQALLAAADTLRAGPCRA